MLNTIFITGASGNVGSEIARQLKDAPLRVIAGSSSGKLIDGLENRRADLADADSLAAAFEGVDTLFLLLPLQANMLELARNAVAAAKAAGVKHIVHSSGAGADPASPVAIARLHGEIDQLLLDSGIPVTLTLPNSFMQNFITYQREAIRNGAFYLPQGEGKVSFVDVRDLAAANAAILQAPERHAGKRYTLTGSSALSNADAACVLSDALGHKVDYVAVPDDAAIAVMRDAGMEEWTINQLMSLNRVIAAGHTAAVSPELEQLIGRAPIAFGRFVADYLAAWR